MNINLNDIKAFIDLNNNKLTIKDTSANLNNAKFEAKANKLPFSDLAGVIASVKTSDGSEKLAISISEQKKYSQLIADEFFKNVKEK